MSSTKRLRTGETVVIQQRAAKRPITKEIVFLLKDGVAGTQVSTTLFTATFPCTIAGLRWNVSALADGGSANSTAVWAIVKVTEGNTVNTMSTSDAGTLYAPEQECIVWGVALPHAASLGGNSEFWEGTTKVMRKMQGGDTLVWIAVSEATNTCSFRGAIQFFCRT